MNFFGRLTGLLAATWLVFASGALSLTSSAQGQVTIRPGQGELSAILYPHRPEQDIGWAWQDLDKPRSPDGQWRDAVKYLREAVRKMTGRELPIRTFAESMPAAPAEGAIVLTLASWTPALLEDAAVARALAPDPTDRYAHVEAYAIVSRGGQVIVVANTADGMLAAVVELLEQVGYEVLGMGPNWIHVPDHRETPLLLDVQTSGRPGYYIRQPWAVNLQHIGRGTLGTKAKLNDPRDEHVEVSYRRWQIGTRTAGQSMPNFPGHAMYQFHLPVLKYMRDHPDENGFLYPVQVGPSAARPQPSESHKNLFWLTTDETGPGGKPVVYRCMGDQWRKLDRGYMDVYLDITRGYVRQLMLDTLKARAEAAFQDHPQDMFIFCTEPEDGSGGYENYVAHAHDRWWYKTYRELEGMPLGTQPYVLHSHFGVDQPLEVWDETSPANTMFGLDNWLLREFDKWIDSLPPDQHVTSAGVAKKSLVRISHYSYNQHDVPPTFNLDPRIRVMIAGFPKHRGGGKWRNLRTALDVAAAMRVMLPDEPSAIYDVTSLAYFLDQTIQNACHRLSLDPVVLLDYVRLCYANNVRAACNEIDFNFGKMGAAYYMLPRLWWNPGMTPAQARALFDRWLQRCFGDGWEPMRDYYTLIDAKTPKAMAPNFWSSAVRLIDEADARIDPDKQPDAQRRIDDFKQHWYYYHLIDTNQAVKTNAAMQTFAWKGQMSYMVAMHAVAKRVFAVDRIWEALPEERVTGPAHYSAAETAQWWEQVKAHWQYTPVTNFADTQLADGLPAAQVDLYDLVSVPAFALPRKPGYLVGTGQYVTNGYLGYPPVLVSALRTGQDVGFQISWDHGNDARLHAVNVFYGIEWWDAKARTWQAMVDPTMTSVATSRTMSVKLKRERQWALVRFPAPQPGVYRITVSNVGGNYAILTGLESDSQGDGHDPASSATAHGFTFEGTCRALTQEPAWFYIPKGTAALELETWDADWKKITLYKALPPIPANATRTIELDKARKVMKIELQPEETGKPASLLMSGFTMPYLYSVPYLWAKSPEGLLIPRAIAQADGWLPLTENH